ncbi:hypothetical protein HOLleu_21311 [Holothuria leucospilota]|uniref:Uncharacterized protein n=1 Tax=Holothuria leucospilota TaxID=206669 RepID=A0A9Q1BXI8_HOLLE|nr:hypothetical protein HOLleu_21311 [Holothuria leucospilota]
MATESIPPNPMEAFLKTKERVLASTKGLCIGSGRSNYQEDFTAKPIIRRQKKPTSDNRKNNPHPCHLSHLRRLCNEPVCKVKTIITQLPEGSSTYTESLMRHHYPLPPSPSHRPTRFGCNKYKKEIAEGIVPASTEKESTNQERLLPACTMHTTLMSTAHPYQYIPRRRRLIQPHAVGDVFACIETCLPDKTPLGKSVLHNRPTRRLVSSAPKTTLVVAGFDGGAPPDPTRTITGRKRAMIPTLTKFAGKDVPGWMKPY